MKNKRIKLSLNLVASIAKTIYGEIDLSQVQISVGTPLVLGKKYIVDNLTTDDDISNCGYVAIGQIFTATNTTPNMWLGSSVYMQNENLVIYQNDVDANVSIEKMLGTKARLKITNGGFLPGKTFPNIVSGSFVEILDTNTIEFSSQIGVKYFKIEILN